jgi:adenylate kinase
MACKIVFLGGIHGTGKGYISKKLCDSLPIKYLSASELIKWENISPDKKNKAVDNIPNTQNRLINALKASCVENENYLLDGHYCLLNSIAEPTKIEFDIFSEINPVILLIITADPQLIKDRLANRDNRNYDISLINEMQSLEKEYAEEISIKLQVPLYFVNETNIDEVGELIKSHL